MLHVDAPIIGAIFTYWSLIAAGLMQHYANVPRVSTRPANLRAPLVPRFRFDILTTRIGKVAVLAITHVQIRGKSPHRLRGLRNLLQLVFVVEHSRHTFERGRYRL